LRAHACINARSHRTGSCRSAARPPDLLIQHVSFEVRPDQLDACIEFYELLGFRRVTTPKELAEFVTWQSARATSFICFSSQTPHI
jgi:hypothetical protein